MRTAILLSLLAIAAGAQSPPVPTCCPAQPERQKQKLLWREMEKQIDRRADSLDGVMSVALIDLTSGEDYFRNADEVMPQASSIKITVLLELYKQAEERTLSLDDEYVVRSQDLVPDSDIVGGLTPGKTRITLRDLATMMVAVSDNSATNVLIDRIGMDKVNARLEKLGLHTTRLRRKMMDIKGASEGRENVSSAREMAELLRLIFQGKVLGAEQASAFWKMLSTHKDSPFNRALPGDADPEHPLLIADKPGELEAVRNDSGVIFVSGRPFILCVMTSFLHDEEQGNKAIGEVATAAYSYFDRVARSSEYGRVVSTRNSK